MIEHGARLGVALLFCAAPVQAETLREAIAVAYATNPELAEASARQDALSELPEQAKSAGRPTLDANVGAGYDNLGFGNFGSAKARVVFPIWTGGRVSSALRSANAEVAAGQQRVRDREAEILERVVIAYANLLFAREAIDVAQIGIDRLDRQVNEARSRYDLGEATLTDVAQLRAQRAEVIGNLADAHAELDRAVATYRAVVGMDPGDLAPESMPPSALPKNLDAAISFARLANPLLIEQQHIVDASSARIDGARAERAPRVDLIGGYGRGTRFADGSVSGFESAANAGITLTIPLGTGGLIPSRVREAQATFRAEQFALIADERETVRAVENAWATLRAVESRKHANEEGLAAAELALDGVRAEYEFGLRSTIDILLAEQSYRAAQLALARTRSDLLIAQASLLRASGLLNRDAYL